MDKDIDLMDALENVFGKENIIVWDENGPDQMNGVPRHSYVPDHPHYEKAEHDSCQFEWDWPLKNGGTSRTRCRSTLADHLSLGWK